MSDEPKDDDVDRALHVTIMGVPPGVEVTLRPNGAAWDRDRDWMTKDQTHLTKLGTKIGSWDDCVRGPSVGFDGKRWYREVGGKREDLPRDEAAQIFGLPVVEAMERG